MGVYLVDRDLPGITAEGLALYWEGQDGQSSVHTFAELRERSARFAHFLQAQGIQPGDRVACLPRIPELLVVVLGVWRAGAVYIPLFTAFGGRAIDHRLERSAARLIVTDTANRPRLVGLDHLPPVMTLRREPKQVIPQGDFDSRPRWRDTEPTFPRAPHWRRSLYLHADVGHNWPAQGGGGAAERAACQHRVYEVCG